MLLKLYTDQIAAIGQPITQSCKIKQIMPVNGLPMVKKPNQGIKIQINNLMWPYPN